MKTQQTVCRDRRLENRPLGGTSMDKLVVSTSFVICLVSGMVPAKADIIPVSSTIQAAVDAAEPGDIIVVPPGTYRESVRVLKDNLTIVGPEKAIIDASGFVNGIHVGADIFAPSQNPVCPATAVHNFAVTGLTVRNAASNGIFLSGVDGYVIARGNYLNNGDYATYPSCSNNGHIVFNYAKGGSDTCLYIGNDVSISVSGNKASGCTVGIQIVNSSNFIVSGNNVTGNTTGILAIVDPLNPRIETSDGLIEKNTVANNNLPNTSSDEDISRIPAGTGILNVATDRLTIRGNTVTGNNTLGVAMRAEQLLGHDFATAQALGLTHDWAAKVIAATGNYGEIFQRTVGKPYHLGRGLTLWTAGGLMSPLPMR